MRSLLIGALTATSAFGYQPTQTDLQTSLARAAAAWGQSADTADVRVIRLDYLNPCRDAADVGAWSDFTTRVITINSACAWTPDILQIAVTHEYGHMLNGPRHSRNRKSIMYPVLWYGQHITQADRRKTHNAR